MRIYHYSGMVCVLLLITPCLALEEARVCKQDQCIQAELAKTSEERGKGLMFKDTLQDNEGMLFVFEQSDTHSFWMKNMLISLDMVWLDDKGHIVDIKERVPPCTETECASIVPEEPARYVLEIKSGRAQQLKWSKGDLLTINL